MAQFRTSADIIDLALQNAGEVTSGTSSYEAQALNYLNRVHMAIIAGGTIPLGKDQTVEIDEVWPWAKAKRPLIIELIPKYITGTVSLTTGDSSGVFSAAPTLSMAGRHIRINGREEWFKIASHTASSTAFDLDGQYPDETGAALSFEVAKLDYELIPSYIVIDSSCNKVQFQEAAGTTLTATLTSGTYTPDELAAQVQIQLLSTGGAPAYTVTYSSTTRKFTIASDRASSAVFVLVGTGTQTEFSAHRILGFDDVDSTNAASITSTYVLGGIARLIEPFRMHKGSGEGIRGTDSESFHRNYPLSTIGESLPDRFTVIKENPDGTLTVRFNGFPQSRVRIEVEHVPVPRDLKDSSASVPLIPRKHIDVLEDATTFYIMMNKSDDRAQVYAGLMQGKLKAMVAQNRGSLLRAGENFGQFVARRDMVKRAPRRMFAYPSSQPATSADSSTPMVTVVKSYTSFQTAALTTTVTARTLAANRTLFAVIIKHSTVFAGGAISALTLSVGIAGDTTKFINSFNVMQAVSDSAQDSNLTVYFPATATPLIITATAVGANLDALTAGSVTLYFQEVVTE